MQRDDGGKVMDSIHEACRGQKSRCGVLVVVIKHDEDVL